MILEAILLGLSTGTYCTMYCGPVLIPFLCGSNDLRYKRNAGLAEPFVKALQLNQDVFFAMMLNAFYLERYLQNIK